MQVNEYFESVFNTVSASAAILKQVLVGEFDFRFRSNKKPNNITDWPDDQCQVNSLDQGQCPSNDKQQWKDHSFPPAPSCCNIAKDPQYAANIDGTENDKYKYVCGAC